MSNTSKAYVLIFMLIYVAAFATAVFVYQLSFTDILITFLCVGLGFSFIAWLLTQNIKPELRINHRLKMKALY